MEYDVLVIGGGPAGLAAAISASKRGAKVALAEKDATPGGILNQCIHNGFGLKYFGEDLTGTEFAARILSLLPEEVTVFTETTAIAIDEDKTVTLINPVNGKFRLKVKSVVLATGCRERTAGEAKIPGDRPSGVYTAGTVKKLINMYGYLPGKRAVIVGSGDVGLITARRLTLEGAEVLGVFEKLPYPSGLRRNIQACLQDYNIPLRYNTTVSGIIGRKKLEGVIVTDSNGKTEYVACDLLVLALGLIPENCLAEKLVGMSDKTMSAIVSENRETSVPGLFMCGNALHVHDLVDDVASEAEKAGTSAADYALSQSHADRAEYPIKCGEGIAYTVPQKFFEGDGSAEIYFRADRVFPKCRVSVRSDGKTIYETSFDRLLPSEQKSISFPKYGCKEVIIEVKNE